MPEDEPHPMTAEEIAAGLSEAERAWLRFWAAPNFDAPIPDNYPRPASAEKDVKKFLSYCGLAWSSPYSRSFDLTPLGRSVAAALLEQKA